MATEQTLEEVLEHYGIKGMRWGVRRSPEQLARARGERIRKGKPVTMTRAARKAKRQAKREANTSEDAKSASEAAKKAKKRGIQSLSNEELQTLNNRMNLETQYKKLSGKQKSEGEKFVQAAMQGPTHSQKQAASIAGDLAAAGVAQWLKNKS